MNISGNGINGNEHINIAVPGFNAIIITGGGYLGDLIEYIVFGLFVYYFYLKVSAASPKTERETEKETGSEIDMEGEGRGVRVAWGGGGARRRN